MKMQTVTISGFRGPQQVQLPANGELITLNRDGFHGDWKTASVRPGAWPTIPKGTQVEVLKVFICE